MEIKMDRFKFRVITPDGVINNVTGFVIDTNKSKIRIFRMNADMPDGMGTQLFMLSEVIIEQCTGLKDKNGTLIYEGDIVDCEEFINPRAICWRHSKWQIDRTDILLDEMEVEWFNIEVIGNIHENPELLI